MNRKWLIYFIKKSILTRWKKVTLLMVSTTVATSIITQMVILSTGMRGKLSNELRAYGANVIITSDEYIHGDIIERLKKFRKIEDIIPEVYAKVCTGCDRNISRKVSIIGTDMNKFKDVRLEGSLPEGKEILAGFRISRIMGLKIGDMVSLCRECMDKPHILRISGIFEKTGPEDMALYGDYNTVWKITGLKDHFSVIKLRLSTEDIEETVMDIRREFPDLQVKTLREVVVPEESILKKMEILLFLVSVFIIFATMVTVASTIASIIFERMDEIGLMKAMGADDNMIYRFLLYEVMAVGIISGSGGFVFGTAFAEITSKSAFGTFIEVKLYVLPVSIFTGLFLSIVSGLPPIRNILKRSPVEMLRGEV